MKPNKIFFPKILTAFSHYSGVQFGRDLLAGLIVAIIAIPLSIAFGIGSGVTPAQGLVTGIVAGLIVSLLGGSRVQIGGPTGAFIVIVYGIVLKFGVSGLLVATLMAGVILVLMGLLRFGSVVRFIPQPIIVGFSAGIAVLILSGQLKDALGLSIQNVPVELFDKVFTIFSSIHQTNLAAVALCVFTVGIIVGFKRFFPGIPGAFVALVCGTVGVSLFSIPVATVGSTFGTVSLTITPLSFQGIGWKELTALIGPAFSIAFLCAIERLLSAAVADAMIGGKHRPNTELIAQGIANIGSSLVGGIPATGAIARTAANIKNGGRTPIAGVVHALVLLLIVVFLGPLASAIPLAVLAGILITVAIGMGEWREFGTIAHTSRSDALALWLTFLTTIFVDLVFAIAAGMIVSSFFFIRSMSEKSQVHAHTDMSDDIDTFYSRPDALSHFVLPEACVAIELSGQFFFGAATKFEESIQTILEMSEVLILRFTELDLIDATGVQVLKRLIENARKRKVRIICTEIPDTVMETLRRSGLLDLLGRKNIVPTMVDAIQATATNESKRTS